MKVITTVEYYTKSSPTCQEIVRIFPEGTSPTVKEIEDLYIKLSKTEYKDKGKRENGSLKLKSNRSTKKRRGRRFYKRLRKLGFWVAPSYLNL